MSFDQLREQKLEELDDRLRVAFALSCARRVLPVYLTWAEGEGKGWAIPQKFEEAAEFLLSSFDQSSFPVADIQKLKGEVSAGVPHTEHPWRDIQGVLDAGVTLLQALECAIQEDNLKKTIQTSDSSLCAVEISDELDAELLRMTGETFEIPEQIIGAYRIGEAAKRELIAQITIINRLQDYIGKSIDSGLYVKCIENDCKVT